MVRPILAELRRRFEVSAAETGDQDLYRRCEIGVCLVAADPGHCHQVLASCERLVAGRSEVEVLAARLRVWDDEDE